MNKARKIKIINKPQGYDEAQAYTGESMQLPAGLYVCKIRQVNETQTQNGRPQMAILVDVAEGEHNDFYQAQFEAEKRKSGDRAK